MLRGMAKRAARVRIPLLRTTLIAALLGHGVANWLFEAGQYEGAPALVTSHLSDPLIVQTSIVVGLVALITLWRWYREPGGHHVAPGGAGGHTTRLVAGFTVLQLALFGVLETSERIWIQSLTGYQEVAPLGDGFLTELLVAVAVACLMALLATVTLRAIRKARTSSSMPRARTEAPLRPQRALGAPSPQVLAGSGAVRAPPVAA